MGNDTGIDRINIFSNGSQFCDWAASNCLRCKKWSGWEELPTCEIDMALGIALLGDGTVTKEIAERAGFNEDTRGHYVWQCGEVEWTEEWTAEVMASQSVQHN